MLSPGQSFGNYRILEKIGVGGMGAVYLAHHPLIGKKVALKVIHNELSANKEVISRFFNEARAASQIGSEHIVQIHDFGQTDDGQHFYIMEHIDGRTLASVLTHEGTVDPLRVLHISAQIASGLNAAHEKNIIHRDLKPDNIMLLNRLGDADFVKILDFGLAKLLDNQKQLTAIGVVLGTPQYMSPEACESRQDIDRRSDIYSLGILMFQMLTGRVPFQGNSMGEVLVKQVTKLPPAPRALNPVVPPSVEQIVLRCLAKDRESRFPDMKQLRQALLNPEKYLASSPPVVQAAGGITRPPPIAGAAKSTQFFQGVPDDNPILATLPPVGPAPNEGGGAAPQKTRFLAGAPAAAGAGAAPPVDENAVTSKKAPAHAARTEYGGPPAATGAPPAAAGPAQGAAAKTAYMRPGAPGGEAPPPAAGPGAAKTAYMRPGASQGGPPPAAPGVAGAPGASGPTAKTAYAGPGPGAAPPGGAAAKTAYMDPSQGAGGPPPMAEPGPVMPELSPPKPAKNVTMAIGPPPGYHDRPPRSSLSVVLAAAGVTLIGGFLFLGFVAPGFLRDGGGNKKAAVDAAIAADAAVAMAPPRAIDAAPPHAPDAAPATVRIEVLSDPPGAEVLSADGKVLATTPGFIELPRGGDERVLTFRHPGTETQTTKVVPESDTRIRVELPKKEPRHRPGHRGKRHHDTHRDDTLTPNFH